MDIIDLRVRVALEVEVKELLQTAGCQVMMRVIELNKRVRIRLDYAEALLRGETVAAIMESQPDDRGRALVGAVLAIQTDEDEAGLMRMAQDCLRKMRVERLAKEWEEIQRTLPNVPESEQPALMERAVRLTIQLKALE